MPPRQRFVSAAQTACWNLPTNKLWENNARIDTNGIRQEFLVVVAPFLGVYRKAGRLILLQEKLLTVTLVTVTQYRASWLQ